MEKIEQKIIETIYKKCHNNDQCKSLSNGDYLMGTKGVDSTFNHWSLNFLDEICDEMGFWSIYLDIQNDLFEFEIKINNDDPTIFINLTRHDIFYRHQLNIRDEALKNLDI